MKKILTLTSIIALSATTFTRAAEDKAVELKTDEEKLSYTLGTQAGRSLKRTEIGVDYPTFLQGFKDAMEDAELALTDEEVEQVMNNFRDLMRKKQEERMAKQAEEAEKNKEAGQKFLEENKAKEGIVALESGLQYQILEEGKGEKPKENQKVKVHYKGTLLDGTEFDSSHKRGEPAEFFLGRVIRGWTEALQLMPVGSKWKLFIPADLAYGDRHTPTIPGGSTLVFEVELLEILEGEEEPQMPQLDSAEIEKLQQQIQAQQEARAKAAAEKAQPEAKPEAEEKVETSEAPAKEEGEAKAE